MYKRILIPTDGSKCSEHAIKHGLPLAKAMDAEITFLYIIENMPSILSAEAYSYASYAEQLLEDLRKSGRESLDKGLALAADAGVTATTKLEELSHPVDSISEYAKKHDLIIMASHARQGISRIFLGSVTEGVLRHSSTPLLVVRCPPSE